MNVEANDSGVRYHRTGDVDTASYFYRELIVHKGEKKVISAWSGDPEDAKVEFEKKMKAFCL